MAERRAGVTKALLYEALKAIQGTPARHSDDVCDIKERLGNLELRVGGLAGQCASLSVRIDRLEARIERIERRLELVEG
ncbi:MAG: hypothetical protein KJZ85_16555 [Rhodobacteraceae bacterium]|jgi:hypothetical protein|nr:hypothetical protein [Paracoccaceae bacterium]